MENDHLILMVVSIVAVVGIVSMVLATGTKSVAAPVVSSASEDTNTGGQAMATDYGKYLAATPDSGYTGSYQSQPVDRTAPTISNVKLLRTNPSRLDATIYDAGGVDDSSVIALVQNQNTGFTQTQTMYKDGRPGFPTHYVYLTNIIPGYYYVRIWARDSSGNERLYVTMPTIT